MKVSNWILDGDQNFCGRIKIVFFFGIRHYIRKSLRAPFYRICMGFQRFSLLFSYEIDFRRNLVLLGVLSFECFHQWIILTLKTLGHIEFHWSFYWLTWKVTQSPLIPLFLGRLKINLIPLRCHSNKFDFLIPKQFYSF